MFALVECVVALGGPCLFVFRERIEKREAARLVKRAQGRSFR